MPNITSTFTHEDDTNDVLYVATFDDGDVVFRTQGKAIGPCVLMRKADIPQLMSVLANALVLLPVAANAQAVYDAERTWPEVRAERINEWTRKLTEHYNAQGHQGVTFYAEKLRKYTRIVMETAGGSRSVHAFFDPATGDVLKAAGWKAPAKGVRFNLKDDDSFKRMLDVCDWSGHYLYVR